MSEGTPLPIKQLNPQKNKSNKKNPFFIFAERKVNFVKPFFLVIERVRDDRQNLNVKN